MRLRSYLENADRHDRDRQSAVRQWQRRLEDASIDPPEAPKASATYPRSFEEGGHQFRRDRWPEDLPIRCGHCGRLVFLVDDSWWWCPEHEGAVKLAMVYRW